MLQFYKNVPGVIERLMLAGETPEIEAWGPEHYGGLPVSLHVYVDDCDT